MLFALLAQPLLAALLGAALFPLVDLTGRPLYGGHPASIVDSTVAFALGVGVTAAGVTLFGACPLLLWLLSHGPVARRHALLSGLLLGNAPAAIMILNHAFRNVGTTDVGVPLDVVYGSAGGIRIVVFGSVMGVRLAWLFYWICGDYLAPAERTKIDR